MPMPQSPPVRTQTRRGAVAHAAMLIALMAGGSGCTGQEVEEEELPSGIDNPTDWASQGALLTAPSKPSRTIAVMMFDIGGGPPNATTIMNVVGGTGSSQRHMFQEISYGIQDTAPEYFGPFRLPVNNCLTIACCGPSSDRTGNGATVQMHMDAIGKQFNHYFWSYGMIPSGANCGTWGDEGSPNRIAKYTSYSFHGIVGYAQELGHNFGMTHEPTLTCQGGASFLDNTSQCTHKEYGNSLSFMGGGARHPSTIHKYHQGWIAGCNVVKAGASSKITLVPQELPCNGAQLIQIPAPKTRPAPAAGDRQGSGPMLTHYYLEMRAPYGFDSGLGPMVLVSIGPELPAPTRNAPYVYMLDLAPGTTTHTDAGLRTVGQSYSDPSGGFTVTLDAIDTRSASVSITTGGTGSLTCVDGTPFTAPGLDATSCGPLFGGGGATQPGTGGQGGTGGMAGGTGGVGGRGGAGGRGGSGGAGNTTGAGGMGGMGMGGMGGMGGSAVPGTGGATVPGTGGSTTTGPDGGNVSGTGGSVTGGRDSGAPGVADVTGGCGCDSGGGAAGRGGRSTPGALFFSALMFAGWAARRRSRRAPSS